MRAKDKAIELVEKYDETLTYLESKSKAKQCALIAVDLLINNTPTKIKSEFEIVSNPMFDYWQEVKQEIEKL